MATIIDKFLQKIREATSRPGIYAYRGQAKSPWPLRSAATRRLIENLGNDVLKNPRFANIYADYHRNTLVDAARTRGFGVEAGRDISDLQLLAKLQHFGAATGLLDFTWDPLVSLWFASREASDCNGKLFILNTNDTIHVAKVPSDQGGQTIDAVFYREANAPGLLYCEPMWSGDAMPRILRQRGVFVIGRPLIPTDSQIITEIEIPKDDKNSLLEELALLDIGESSLFPDIYGFSASEGVSSSIRVTDPQFYLVQGNHHFQSGDYAQAITAYDNCIELASDIGEPYFLRGNAKSEAKLYRDAIEDYGQAMAHKDQPFLSLVLDINEFLRSRFLVMVYFNCGNALAALDDYEEALLYYGKAIEVSLGEPVAFGREQALFNRGNTYMDLGKFREAIGDYDKAIALGEERVIFNKGNALVALGRFNEAVECYRQAEQEQRDRSSAVQNLSALERIVGEIGPREYQCHVEQNPDDVIGHVLVQVSGGDSSSVVEVFKGRVGNTGSYGWKGPGGKGFHGKRGFVVMVAVQQKSDSSD